MNFIAETGLTAEQIKKEIQEDSAVLIDVREHEEVEAGHLSGAYWLALSELSQSPESFLDLMKEKFQRKKIYLYCKSGGRSGQASAFFQSHGFSSYNIGGFQELSTEFDHQVGEMRDKKIS